MELVGSLAEFPPIDTMASSDEFLVHRDQRPLHGDHRKEPLVPKFADDVAWGPQDYLGTSGKSRLRETGSGFASSHGQPVRVVG